MSVTVEDQPHRRLLEEALNLNSLELNDAQLLRAAPSLWATIPSISIDRLC